MKEATTHDSGEVVAVEAEIDPIPFDRVTDKPSHEFYDGTYCRFQ